MQSNQVMSVNLVGSWTTPDVPVVCKVPSYATLRYLKWDILRVLGAEVSGNKGVQRASGCGWHVPCRTAGL